MPAENADSRHSFYAVWSSRLFALFVGLIGIVLAAGGAWLAVLGGTLYYLLAGIALMVAAVLFWRRSASAIWLYAAIFLATLIWALWEVGLDGWALMPRLAGPVILLFLSLALAPAMKERRPRGGALAALALPGLIACALIAYGIDRATEVKGGPAAIAASPQMVANLARASSVSQADWANYGGTPQAQRFSALAQITPANVGTLERAWVAHTGDLPSDMEDNKYGAETTPLKIGNRLFLCSATNILIALDARTGEEIWRHDPEVGDEYIPYTAACRGVVHYRMPEAQPGQICAARIIEGTLDGRLVAVDAATGTPCPGFGEDGSVDITTGMGDVVPGMVSITSPPVVARGNIITGHQVLDGQSLSAPSGVIQAFDAETGNFVWAWDMAAPNADPTESGRDYTRGTPNMWTMATADEELGLVYLPMGNSAGDYWSSDRSPEENRYATSLVALDAESGRPRWHFQTVRMDVWDYDLGSQPTLVDLPGGLPALVLASKQGDIYVINRATGEMISRVEDRPAPQGGVEPAMRAATQPHSLYHTLAKPDLTEQDMWGISPVDQLACRIQVRRATYDGIYTPPTTERRWVQYPGYNGGSDWGGIAIDPINGIIVANYNDMPNYNRLVPRAEADRKGWVPRGEARGGSMGSSPEGAGDPMEGAPFAIDVNAGWRLPITGLLCKQPPYGGIRAIDLSSGQTIWDRPFGTARRNGPFGIPSMLPVTIGTPNNGGSVVTAGGLIFIAAATDNMFTAIDMKSGATLWQDELPAGGQATPITYEADGRQYVVVMAGGHHFMETPVGDALVAYALPARTE
jgi:quinoprotein glucose dehydrogenase